VRIGATGVMLEAAGDLAPTGVMLNAQGEVRAGPPDSPQRATGTRFLSIFTSTVYSGSTSWMTGAWAFWETNW